MKHEKYYYHIEDGQFSYDIELDKLLGIEGQTIKLSPYSDKESETDVYILYIDKNYVECIGSVENSFPKTPYEHEEFKEHLIKLNS